MKLLAASVLSLAALTTACATPPAPITEPAPAPPRELALPMPAAATVEPLAQNETQVGRYTTVTTEPAEADANPLAVIAKVHFPRSVVNTVGDAVRYVLIRTGYQLAAEDTLDARVKAVFGLRLPDNQRVLGPYRVDTMLGVLMGHPYKLVADPGSRTVTYIASPALGSDSLAPSATATRRVNKASADPV